MTAPALMLEIRARAEFSTIETKLDEFTDATECVRAFVNVLRGLEFADESIKSALEEVRRGLG
jgi:hypothetical protein